MIGFPVPDWTPRRRPPHSVMHGRTCRVEPMDIERHAPELFEANTNPDNWTYLMIDMPADLDTYRGWLWKVFPGVDPFLHAIVDNATNRAVGVAAFMRIDPAHGAIEIGHVNFSPRLQRTVMATEAMYLMMKRVFDELGYRRYEWKLDNLNEPSHAAAQRLGFTYEGIFRQMMVYKGRNRDTAWYSMLDKEWPPIRSEYERWLDPSNFDAEGRQRTPLRRR